MSEQSSPTPHIEWDLADRLRKSLRIADIGVQEMADELEVGRNTVGNYINGRTTPNPSTMRVWALRCGVPYAWLRDGTEPSNYPGPSGGAAHVTSGNDVLNGMRTDRVVHVLRAITPGYDRTAA